MAAAVARLQAAATPAAVAMAENIAGGFKLRAPRRTGRLASSTDTRPVGPGVARLAVGAPYAGFVEYGTSDTPAQHPLAASVDEGRLTGVAATIMRRAL